MEYLNRLSSLVTSPAKTATNLGAARRRKASTHINDGSPDAFRRDWDAVKGTLQKPDQRALFFGIQRTDVPDGLRRIVDALVFENNRSTEGHTGPCMEHLLKHDLLEELVQLSAQDQPSGILGEVIRTLTNLVILLDEKFLSRQAAHRPISMLINLCMNGDGSTDDDQDDDPTGQRRTARRSVTDPDAEHNSDLVDLMCHVASRVRNTPDLLLIFFTDERIKATSMAEIGGDPTAVTIAEPAVAAAETGREVRPPSPAGSIDSVATLQPSRAETATEGAGITTYRRLRFPLFSHLLRFAHREGRTGELARAGLLFLITLEVNTSPSAGPRARGGAPAKTEGQDAAALEEKAQADALKTALAIFVANSDFADVFGAGLGAAYGLLPTRIYMAPVHDPTRGPRSDLTLGRSDSELTLGSATAAREPEDHSSTSFSTVTRSDSPELQAQLRLLVDLLDFAQDVLDAVGVSARSSARTAASGEHEPFSPVDSMVEKLATSVAIAVRDTFIKNVVYPSLMESSDVDGSATAVMSYLEVVMLVLRERHLLTEVVLQYLLCYERLPTNDAQFDEADATASRLAYRLADDGADRYSLKDLILDNMSSGRTVSAATAAMKLARTLIVYHGRHANDALLEPRKGAHPSAGQNADGEDSADFGWGAPTKNEPSTRPLEAVPLQISQHVKEIDAYATLLSRFEGAASPEAMLNSLGPYLLDAEQAVRRDSCFEAALRPFPQRRRQMHSHGERCDPTHWFQIRLSPTDVFFQQVCELLARLFRQTPEQNLALSGIISSLAVSPIRSLKGWLTFDGEEDGAGAIPAVLDLLSHLSRQVGGYRENIPDFDRYLADRRKGLLLAEDLSDALEINELTDDDSFGEKGAASDEHVVGKEASSKKLAPSLSLPRTRPPKAAQDADGDIDEASMNALRMVDDRREELSPEMSAKNLATAGEGSQTAGTADADEGTSPAAAAPDARSSALARLFGGRAVKAGAAVAQAGAQPSGRDGSRAAESSKLAASTISPYTRHYQETLAISVQATTAAGAEAWRKPVEIRAMDAGKEDVEVVTLSSVLDNTILLEELIKEILAIIEVRRAWGIDPVSFRAEDEAAV